MNKLPGCITFLLLATQLYALLQPTLLVPDSSLGNESTIWSENAVHLKAINPFYNRIMICSSVELKESTVALYDCRGRQLRTWFDLHFNPAEMLDLDVQELPAGIYFLHVSCKQVMQTLKLVHP